MKRRIRRILFFSLFFSISIPLFLFIPFFQSREQPATQKEYWFMLYRSSNKELLYYGIPGERENSTLIKQITVKTGEPGEKPTPLPTLLGREHWNIVNAFSTQDHPDTAPYFLTLDIPHSDQEPFGPTPYEECNGQCNWELPGPFGLHGVASDSSKLTKDNPGSSGCIRHTDEDISYLFSLLNNSWPVRYYIQDA